MSKILLVEDDEQVAQIFTEWLSSAGHEVKRAISAYTAALHFMEEVPDLVLMDMLLRGGANGVVAALMLRGLGYGGPIVAVTGGAMQIEAPVFARAGFSPVEIRKPLLKAADLLDPLAAAG